MGVDLFGLSLHAIQVISASGSFQGFHDFISVTHLIKRRA
jgi:hypothetical protein